MIHPKTELRLVGDNIGYGVFATVDIPEGTIVFVQDQLDIVINEKEFEALNFQEQKNVEKYSFIDAKGDRILSWDFGKFVNHCCDFNTISTGYGFEIAIRDIKAGEQITDEYGIFNLKEEMTLECGVDCCRKKVQGSDFDNLYPVWDEKIKKSLKKIYKVRQYLMDHVDATEIDQIDEFLYNPEKYKSVYTLRYKGEQVLS